MDPDSCPRRRHPTLGERQRCTGCRGRWRYGRPRNRPKPSDASEWSIRWPRSPTYADVPCVTTAIGTNINAGMDRRYHRDEPADAVPAADERFLLLLDTLPYPAFVIGADSQAIHYNEHFVAYVGFYPGPGRADRTALHHPDDQPVLEAARDTGVASEADYVCGGAAAPARRRLPLASYPQQAIVPGWAPDRLPGYGSRLP